MFLLEGGFCRATPTAGAPRDHRRRQQHPPPENRARFPVRAGGERRGGRLRTARSEDGQQQQRRRRVGLVLVEFGRVDGCDPGNGGGEETLLVLGQRG